MRRRLFSVGIGLAVVIAALSGWSYLAHAPEPPPGPEIVERRFSPRELGEDLDFMLRTFEEVHPDLYFKVSQPTVAAAADDLRAGLRRPMTREEFWPALARLAASFGDGHTGVEFPGPEFARRKREGALWFPVVVDAFDEGRLHVVDVLEPGTPLEPDAWMTSINGRPVETLVPALVALISGEKAYFRRFTTLRNLPTLLWLTGVDPPFEIEWESDSTNGKHRAVLEGVPWKVLSDTRRGGRQADTDFRFERLDDGIGYLELRHMRRLGAFRSFLERTFRDIAAHPVSGLVIDLRRNGGGSTSLGDALLSYVTDKPYRFVSRLELKVSRQKKRWLEEVYFPRALGWLPLWFLHPALRRIWSAPEGSLLEDQAPMKRPSDNPLRYTGPTCVLIGPRTFSSAQKLANAIKDYRLATLIGQETGGNPNAFGEVYSFRLPHTRLVARVSTKRYVRANGDASWTRGILPDIEVVPTSEDLRAGRDPVLEAARRWLLERRKKK